MAEILKSLRTPRPKKDEQAMAPMRVPAEPATQQIVDGREGEVVTIETDEEEEDL